MIIMMIMIMFASKLHCKVGQMQALFHWCISLLTVRVSYVVIKLCCYFSCL